MFDHVGFAYDKKKVLDGVNFTAREGEVTALVGPSGSGKSTCARLAARLWDVTEGTIRVGDVDISTVDPEALLTDYSMVFQDVVLFDDTVMENIRLGKRGATDEEVRAAAEAANCGEFIRRLPQGYDTPIGENGAKLSGGERQRISCLLYTAPIFHRRGQRWGQITILPALRLSELPAKPFPAPVRYAGHWQSPPRQRFPRHTADRRHPALRNEAGKIRSASWLPRSYWKRHRWPPTAGHTETGRCV